MFFSMLAHHTDQLDSWSMITIKVICVIKVSFSFDSSPCIYLCVCIFDECIGIGLIIKNEMRRSSTQAPLKYMQETLFWQLYLLVCVFSFVLCLFVCVCLCWKFVKVGHSANSQKQWAACQLPAHLILLLKQHQHQPQVYFGLKQLNRSVFQGYRIAC